MSVLVGAIGVRVFSCVKLKPTNHYANGKKSLTEHIRYKAAWRLSDCKQCKRWKEVNEKASNCKPLLYTDQRKWKKRFTSAARKRKHRNRECAPCQHFLTRRWRTLPRLASKLRTNCHRFLATSKGFTVPRVGKHLSIMHFLSSPYIKNYCVRQKQTIQLDLFGALDYENQLVASSNFVCSKQTKIGKIYWCIIIFCFVLNSKLVLKVIWSKVTKKKSRKNRGIYLIGI